MTKQGELLERAKEEQHRWEILANSFDEANVTNESLMRAKGDCYRSADLLRDLIAEIERLRTALNNISAGVSYERSREIADAALRGDE